VADHRARTYAAQDGLRLSFRDYGPADGATVLCLPGLARSARDFAALAERLTAGIAGAPRRVLTPDYRGRGASAWDPDWRHYRAEVYLDDIRHLLIVAGVHRVTVVGTSLGGLLAMGLAVVVPTAVAAVVLNDVGPHVDPGPGARILAYVGEDVPLDDWDAAVVRLKNLFPNLSLDSDEAWRTFARNTYRQGPFGPYADERLHVDWDPAIVRPLRQPRQPERDLWALFGALGHVPLMTVRGGVSDVLTAATFAEMRRRRPDMAAVELPGVGHCPTLAEPAVEAVLDGFLART